MIISSLIIILVIVFSHWVLDFVCQTEKQALGKSKNWEQLLEHTATYAGLWMLPILFLGACLHLHRSILLFIPITFVCHTATDYYTSRVNAQLWADKKTHDFFVSIGFDQFLHYAQLFITFYLLQ